MNNNNNFGLLFGIVTTYTKGNATTGSTVDVTLLNGDELKKVPLMTSLGSHEKVRGYCMIEEGMEVILLKGTGSNVIVIGEIAQGKDNVPLEVSSNEYEHKYVNTALGLIADAITEISNSKTTNGGTLVNKGLISAYTPRIKKQTDIGETHF